MRIRARTVVGLMVLASTVVGAGLINARLKSMTVGVGLGDHPTRTSIVFPIQRNQKLHYRLGQARILRMIVNANLSADDLTKVRVSGQPLWFELNIEVEDRNGLVLHRQNLSLRLDPTQQVLDSQERYYLDHLLVPAAGKVRNLDLSALEEAERLNIRMGDTDRSIIDLSVRLFEITRTAERELAYLWTRMNDERKESLARSNLYGRHLMTDDERVNQLRHRWFPLAPEGSDSSLQRKLYTRIDDQTEQATAGHSSSQDRNSAGPIQAEAPAGWPLDDLSRTFGYVLLPGKPFVQTIHHVGSHPTPVRLDLRRLLPADDGDDTTVLRWRLLGPDGRKISSGKLEPRQEPASAEAVNLPGRQTSEPARRYFMVSSDVAGFELTTEDSPLLVTLAVAHPLQTWRISAETETIKKDWFLLRTPDHRQRLTDGRAVTIWKRSRTPDHDDVEYSWERIEPDGIAIWRSLGEPIKDDTTKDALIQRLALSFDQPEISFNIEPAPGQERLMLLRWHAPTERSEALEIEVNIAGKVPVNQPLSRRTSIKRRVTIDPGDGEYPVLGTDKFVRSPQRIFVPLGPEFGQKTLRVIVRCTDPAGYLSASIGAPAAQEWRTLVDSSTESGLEGMTRHTPSKTVAGPVTALGTGQ